MPSQLLRAAFLPRFRLPHNTSPRCQHFPRHVSYNRILNRRQIPSNTSDFRARPRLEAIKARSASGLRRYAEEVKSRSESEEEPISYSEESTSISDSEQPILSISDEYILSLEEPISISDSEEPGSVSEKPISTSEESISNSEDPVSISEEYLSTLEGPISTSEEPISVSEEYVMSLEEPNSISEELNPISEEPISNSEQQISTSEEPISIPEEYISIPEESQQSEDAQSSVVLEPQEEKDHAMEEAQRLPKFDEQQEKDYAMEEAQRLPKFDKQQEEKDYAMEEAQRLPKFDEQQEEKDYAIEDAQRLPRFDEQHRNEQLSRAIQKSVARKHRWAINAVYYAIRNSSDFQMLTDIRQNNFSEEWMLAKKIVQTLRPEIKACPGSFSENDITGLVLGLIDDEMLDRGLLQDGKQFRPVHRTRPIVEEAAQKDVISLPQGAETLAHEFGNEGKPGARVIGDIDVNYNEEMSTFTNFTYLDVRYDPAPLPYPVEQMAFTILQSLLEISCYKFLQREDPSVLDDRGWDCPSAVDLYDCYQYFTSPTQMRTIWSKINTNTVSSGSKAPETVSLETYRSLWNSVALLHQIIAHKTRIPTTDITKLIWAAAKLMNQLSDFESSEVMLSWHGRLTTSLRIYMGRVERAKTQLDERIEWLKAMRFIKHLQRQVKVKKARRRLEENLLLLRNELIAALLNHNSTARRWVESHVAYERNLGWKIEDPLKMKGRLWGLQRKSYGEIFKETKELRKIVAEDDVDDMSDLEEVSETEQMTPYVL